MPHDFAARRNATNEREHQPAERINFHVAIGIDQRQAEMRLKFLDGRARGRDQPQLRVVDDVGGFDHIVLILDLTDNLFDEIFDGDQAVGAAVLIDYERHMDVRRLHANEQVHGRHRRRNVQHVAT